METEFARIAATYDSTSFAIIFHDRGNAYLEASYWINGKRVEPRDFNVAVALATYATTDIERLTNCVIDVETAVQDLGRRDR